MFTPMIYDVHGSLKCCNPGPQAQVLRHDDPVRTASQPIPGCSKILPQSLGDAYNQGRRNRSGTRGMRHGCLYLFHLIPLCRLSSTSSTMWYSHHTIMNNLICFIAYSKILLSRNLNYTSQYSKDNLTSMFADIFKKRSRQMLHYARIDEMARHPEHIWPPPTEGYRVQLRQTLGRLAHKDN